MPTEMEDYLFDLNGYLVLKDVLDADHVAQLNEGTDELIKIERGGSRGKIYNDAGKYESLGIIIRNAVEGGEPFERLIDHPAWMEQIQRFIGPTEKPVLEQSQLMVRGRGEATRLHSGAHKRRVYTQFRYHDGEFRCGEINILMALTDIGPGDGGTMVIPGSHKSNLIHPGFASGASEPGASLESVEGAIEVHMKAGDVLLFVDCLAHGSAKRTNPGQRRILVYRYGPKWQDFHPSKAMHERLTPERQKFLNAPDEG
jgi:ectoine hydroxylase-related dioxygenase (phytanoyl-CoA dioxygenase family)